jgi:hypothetical protein
MLANDRDVLALKGLLEGNPVTPAFLERHAVNLLER